MKSIAKYYEVETYGVYEREIYEAEMSWACWAEWTLGGYEVDILGQTPTGELIVLVYSCGESVEGFEALQLKAQQEARARLDLECQGKGSAQRLHPVLTAAINICVLVPVVVGAIVLPAVVGSILTDTSTDSEQVDIY